MLAIAARAENRKNPPEKIRAPMRRQKPMVLNCRQQNKNGLPFRAASPGAEEEHTHNLNLYRHMSSAILARDRDI